MGTGPDPTGPRMSVAMAIELEADVVVVLDIRLFCCLDAVARPSFALVYTC